ncbi:MAG: pyridoxamine 5'-phosphate oxidase family protein [Bacillota bacterium]
MTKQEIFNLMNSNPAFFLATVDGDQPRTRGMLLYKADESGIVFHTGTFKDLYKQIMKNPKVELCFNDFRQNIQVRVSGELELVDDNNLKDEISEHPSREFLKPWRQSGALADFYKTFAVFRLRNGIATTWTIERNFEPKEEIKL